jgi:hypothetical protein
MFRCMDAGQEDSFVASAAELIWVTKKLRHPVLFREFFVHIVKRWGVDEEYMTELDTVEEDPIHCGLVTKAYSRLCQILRRSESWGDKSLPRRFGVVWIRVEQITHQQLSVRSIYLWGRRWWRPVRKAFSLRGDTWRKSAMGPLRNRLVGLTADLLCAFLYFRLQMLCPQSSLEEVKLLVYKTIYF